MSDELAREQAYVDGAYAALAAMQARTRDVFDRIMSTGGFQDLDHEVAMRRRIALLGDSPRPLLFGRIDGDDGDRWYVGRRHVEDARGDPVVVEWRTPVAEPFYQARPVDPRGLRRRRHLMVENRQLLSIADDVFGDDAADLGEVRLRGGDALLAELERARTGVMLDIVATIQAEQDDVIRAPLAGVLAVQGGPGTGKTAIGLHRAAYLLYNHPDLARAEVMVVGPSRAFLGYIAQVLPSLGEEAVLQVTLADLVPAVAAGRDDTHEAQLIKGDARMAAVIANAVAQRRHPLGEQVAVRIGLRRAVLAPDEVDALVEEQVARGVPYNVGRAALRTRLVNLVYRRFGVMEAEPRELTKAIQTNESLRAALDAVWPAVSSRALIRELLSNPEELARAADGVLDATERDAIHSPRSAKWSTADLALVDEARALLEGHLATYGHVIIDEAQDLSPMQLRMIGRRAPRGSVTVLGDLAQSTGVWSHESWAEVVAHLATPDGWRSSDLTLGYRVPGQVLDFAARLLPEAAPRVPRTESVRRGLRPPRIVRADEGADGARAASEAEALREEGFLVGCIVAPEQHGAVRRAFDDAGVEYGTPERDGILKPITILAAPTAKGLEFDAVVVVEPAAIADGGARGLRLLYVALTRPIQQLSVVHERPLPAALARAMQ